MGTARQASLDEQLYELSTLSTRTSPSHQAPATQSERLITVYLQRARSRKRRECVVSSWSADPAGMGELVEECTGVSSDARRALGTWDFCNFFHGPIVQHQIRAQEYLGLSSFHTQGARLNPRAPNTLSCGPDHGEI